MVGVPQTKNFRDVAQSGSAPALGAGGPRFESWYPDQLKRDYLLAGSRVFLFVVIFILQKKLLLQLEIPFNFRLIKRATDMA